MLHANKQLKKEKKETMKEKVECKENTDHPVVYRCMTIDDYDQVHALWERISGFALRSLDDSREYILRFLQRNEKTSVVCECAGEIVGSILCGHDGRQAFFYHVCVAPEQRHKGIGRAMVRMCLSALRDEKISKASLVAFSDNEVGNQFWKNIGWTPREDFNTYEFLLNEENITKYVD